MAISEARRFLLDSMAYGLWSGLEDNAEDSEAPTIEVGESREVDLTMEDESEDPETLYKDLEKETGVKFEVEVDRDPDGEIFGIMVNHSADSASVTIRDQEELDYVLAKLKEIATPDD
jgi:hypothetical protein